MKIIFLFSLFIFFYIGCQHETIVPTYCSQILKEKPIPFTAIVYGDTRPTLWLEIWRKHYDKERQEVARQIARENPDFIVHVGDIVAEGDEEGCWEIFDKENHSLREKAIPFFPALGNHDYFGNNATALNHYFARFPDLLAQKWYSFTYQHTLCVILDTNHKDLEEYEIQAQERWFREKIQWAESQSKIQFIIVAQHFPPFTNNRLHGDSAFVQNKFLPALKLCSKPVLFFSGHVHTYEHFFIEGVHHIVTGGGGAPLASVEEDPQKRLHNDLLPQHFSRSFHYCKLVFQEDRIQFSMIVLAEDGTWKEQEKFEVFQNNLARNLGEK
jgi:predicted phosphohydrolase